MRPSIKVKAEQVNELAGELSEASNVAVLSLHGLPTSQLSRIRQSMGLNLRINANNILSRALKKADKGLEQLIEHLEGSCGLLLLDEDVFKLSIKLSEKREPAFIKPGMMVSEDIVLEKGPTPFMPGEIMTELTDLGVSVSPKGGKVAVMEDSVIVKAGEEVSEKVAELLRELNIKPVSTGFELIAAFQDGEVFTHDELVINVDEFLSDLSSAHARAVNLAFNINLVTEFTINSLLLKGLFHARNLAREAGVITSDNVVDFMLTARAKANALVSSINWEVKA